MEKKGKDKKGNETCPNVSYEGPNLNSAALRPQEQCYFWYATLF